MYKLLAPLDFTPPYEGSFLGCKLDEDNTITTSKDYIRRFFNRLFFEDVSIPEIRNNIQRLLIIMQGGVGDTLFATPGIRALKEQKPEIEINVCTWNIGLGIIRNNPNIDKQIFTIPSELALHYPDFDEVIDFSRVIGYRPEAEYTNSYDIYNQHFEELFGIEINNKIPEMFLTPDEKIQARNVLIDNGVKATDKVVGIIDQSSNIVRSWPYEYSLELSYKLIDLGYKVVMLGNNNFLENKRYFTCPICEANQSVEINTQLHIQTILRCRNCQEINIITGNNQVPGILWAMGKTDIRQAASLISQCDLVIGPDSGLMHIAGALNIPSLAIFGPLHSDLRLRYMPQANAIQSDMKCSPCFSHNFHVGQCPLGGPNAPCMWKITPDEVVEKSIDILSGVKYYPPPTIEIDSNKPKECVVCKYDKPRQVFRKNIIEYYQCPKCRSIFSHNAPDNNWERYQNRWTELSDELKSVLHDEVEKDLEQISEFISKDDIKLLELGVGEAYYLNEMQASGLDVYGVEASKIGVEKSIEKYGDWLVDRLFSLNFMKTEEIEPLKNIQPNVIVARNFIEHFKDPHVLWAHFAEILADEGILILASPSSELINDWNESRIVNTEEAGQHKLMPSRFGLEELCTIYGFSPKFFGLLPNREFYFVAKK